MLHTSVVPLSATPPREWEVFFRQPLDYTSVFHPNRIRLEGDRLVFESEEHAITTWLHYIDKWIASANQRLAERRVAASRHPEPETWAPPEAVVERVF
jgi:hypothetical protein